MVARQQNHWKTIGTNGFQTKNHWKTIATNGFGDQKPSMVAFQPFINGNGDYENLLMLHWW